MQSGSLRIEEVEFRLVCPGGGGDVSVQSPKPPMFLRVVPTLARNGTGVTGVVPGSGLSFRLSRHETCSLSVESGTRDPRVPSLDITGDQGYPD